MAKISVVNYEEIPGKANQIQNLGEQFNRELSTTWNNVNGLRSTWHGLRYNTLVTYFNKAQQPINEMLKLVINEIPEALGQVAKNYANADGSSVASVGAGSVTMIEALSDTDTSTMAYNSSEAANVQTSANGNFANAVDLMEQIQGVMDSVEWESEASEAFRSKFARLKAQINDSLNEIKSEFTSMMNAAQADIEGAESANTVQ